jgi:hypothetical protein
MQFMGSKRWRASPCLTPLIPRINSLRVKRNWSTNGCGIVEASWVQKFGWSHVQGRGGLAYL